MKWRKQKHVAVVIGIAAAISGLVAYAASQDWNAWHDDKEDSKRLVRASPSVERVGNQVMSGNHRPTSGRVAPAKIGPAHALETLVYSEPRDRRTYDPASRPIVYPSPKKGRYRYGDHEADFDILSRPSMRSHIEAMTRRGVQAKSMGVTLAAVCDVNQFQSLSGSALVDYIKSVAPSCINDNLYYLTGTAASNTFSETKMRTVADGLRVSSQAYAGTNSGSLIQLSIFMKAGYYVNFYNDSIPAYSSALQTSVKSALDPFFAKSPWLQVNDQNGEVLAELVGLADSSDNQHNYVWVVKALLDSYSNAHAANYYMNLSLTNSLWITYRGPQNEAYRQAVKADPSIATSMNNFIIRNWSRLGTGQTYQVTDVGRELTRFVDRSNYEGSALKSQARTYLADLIGRAYGTGIGTAPNLTVSSPLYAVLAQGVIYYDSCAPYNVCNAATQVEAAVLPIRHTCQNDSDYRIRAQNMTSTQLAASCNTVIGQEAFFHGKFGTAGRPVANDNNTSLEMNVFDSDTDYSNWAGIIFGIDTNNGGMYLEGNPAAAGNQARFIAYEYSGGVWNLNHEFVHYLDGRFNMYGDFGASVSQPTIWWIEGVAEYISYSYLNDPYQSALDLAASRTYSLSTLFGTSYNHDQNRIYRWGYLAVRYMMENRRSNVDTILGHFRQGQYSSYQSYINSLGTSLNSGFSTWLGCVRTGCGTVNAPPVANFNSSVSGLTASFTSTSTDSDGSIASHSWNFGDGTSSTVANPSKTYATAGTYTVSLTVTDNGGASHSVSKSVTVSSPPPPPSNVLNNGVAVTGLSGAQGAELRYTMVVPAGATNLKFVTAGSSGTGDADLYVRFGSAPSITVYDCRSFSSSSNETCSIATIQAGTYHVMVHGYGAFSNASLTGSYTAGGGTNVNPVANFGFTASGLTVSFSDSSTDSDGSIASRSWSFGDGTSSTMTNPSKTYAAAGTYAVTLTVTDNKGATATRTQSVTVSQVTPPPTLSECTDTDVRVLGKNCKRSNVSVSAGNYGHFYMQMPSGVSQLKITVTGTSGGGGNVDLYYKAGGWAYTNDYMLRSTNSGNAETLTVNNPPSGFIGISLHGVTSASGVTISTQY